ncbi:unnamed protein product [Orchesella dallaii]|uniref:Protein EFR3 cmp44E n=1 Tax=Orchesella dallaii TaxID=48710 RepID=A0ABP1RNM1_9HEXA
MVAGCCGCCAPRYKRLVDSVFPRNPQDGLVKSNMEKLTFYVLSSPEKLDRVGEYLYQKVSRDIYRKRNGFTVIGVECMDQLLQACHSQTLNLFVESFLKMVQKLLESPDPNLQILATKSFVKFANIEEDTPSYHRRYDFFVSKFASMCHNNSSNDEFRNEIRKAGIQGLKSVVRKTVSDELVENIWETSHMEKIIPSLLFNMEHGRKTLVKDENDGVTEAQDEIDAPKLAENCMRDLVNKATFGHVRSIVKPVLHHFDAFELWVPNDFAVHTFRVIMFSIQSQYSYAVIETLMNHLEQHTHSSNAKIRTSMADVLAKIIDIAAGESVGPSVLEIVNAIVQHIQVSTKLDRVDGDEKSYRETLISALGEYVTHLPDYQKIEIMKFIMQKVPSRSDNCQSHRLLQNMLLKSLLMVGSKYRTTYLSTTFPIAFLQPLLTLSQDDDPEVRLLVQNILHTLIDRRQNREKLFTPTLKLENINREPSTRTDILFVKKNGAEIFSNMIASLEKNNNELRNMNAIYTTVALFTVELFCEDTLFDFVRLVLSFQDLAITSTVLSPAQKIHLHVIALCLFVLIAYCLPVLKEYSDKVIKARRDQAIHLMPPLKTRYEVYEPSQNIPDAALLSQDAIYTLLKQEGFEPTTVKSAAYTFPRHSWVDAHMQSSSTTDLNSISLEVDSGSSTPDGTKQKPNQTDMELTVESLKKILNEPSENRKAVESEKRKNLNESFKTAAFEDLVSKAAAKGGNLQNKLSEIFSKVAVSGTVESPSRTNNNHTSNHVGNKVRFPNIYEL